MIVETCCPNHDEIILAIRLVVKVGLNLLTSTDFVPRGTAADIVRLKRETVGNDIEVKESDCIRSYRQAVGMIEAKVIHTGIYSRLKIIGEFE